MTTYDIKRGDLAPHPRAQLVGDGGPVNLTDATVVFKTRRLGHTALTIDAPAVIEDPAEGGWVHYEPTEADTATVGEYLAEWQVTFDDDSIETFPGDGFDALRVLADLDQPIIGGLHAVDLDWVRDEIGTATPPDDAELHRSYQDTKSRTLVALRVLKRRRAASAGGATADSFTLAGVLSVSTKTDLKSLDAQIARLEAVYAAELAGTDVDESGTTSTYLTRVTARSRR